MSSQTDSSPPDAPSPDSSSGRSRVRRAVQRARKANRKLRRALGDARKRYLAASLFFAALAVVFGIYAFMPAGGADEHVIHLGEGEAGVMLDTTRPETPRLEQGELEDEELSSETEEEDAASPETGEASFYSRELAGEPTASGEPFNPNRMTAAHRTLPLGTRIRVTNLRNDETVEVRINDRGPFSGNRVLDLSRAAAEEIGMLRRGHAPVRIEVIETVD